jgi:hypothetical protein
MPFADELGMWASRVIDEETVHVYQSETFLIIVWIFGRCHQGAY